MIQPLLTLLREHPATTGTFSLITGWGSLWLAEHAQVVASWSASLLSIGSFIVIAPKVAEQLRKWARALCWLVLHWVDTLRGRRLRRETRQQELSRARRLLAALAEGPAQPKILADKAGQPPSEQGAPGREPVAAREDKKP